MRPQQPEQEHSTLNAAEQLLKQILDELDELGIGGDDAVDGADAVDYLNTLQGGIKRFLKVSA